MIKRSLVSLAALLFVAVAGSAVATPLTLNLDTVITGDTPDGTAPWLTATFTSATPDSVTLVLSAAGLGGSDFIQGGTNGNFGWAFNYGDDAGNLLFGCLSGTCADGVDTGGTTQASGNVGTLDFVFGWNSNNRFGVGDSATYTITNSSDGLMPSDFDLANGKGYFSVAHIQGTSGPDGSGWIASTGPTVSVPEPGGWGLFVLGLAGALFGCRRLRNSA